MSRSKKAHRADRACKKLRGRDERDTKPCPQLADKSSSRENVAWKKEKGELSTVDHSGIAKPCSHRAVPSAPPGRRRGADRGDRGRSTTEWAS
jgi:hypothetical protein